MLGASPLELGDVRVACARELVLNEREGLVEVVPVG